MDVEIFCAAASARGVALDVAEGFVVDAVDAAGVVGVETCGARALGATLVLAVGGFGAGADSLQPTINTPALKRQAAEILTLKANAFDFIAKA